MVLETPILVHRSVILVESFDFLSEEVELVDSGMLKRIRLLFFFSRNSCSKRASVMLSLILVEEVMLLMGAGTANLFDKELFKSLSWSFMILKSIS